MQVKWQMEVGQNTDQKSQRKQRSCKGWYCEENVLKLNSLIIHARDIVHDCCTIGNLWLVEKSLFTVQGGLRFNIVLEHTKLHYYDAELRKN